MTATLEIRAASYGSTLRRAKWLGTAAFAAMLLHIAAARAQTAAVAAAPSTTTGDTKPPPALEEITVTAERRVQSVQSLGSSVSVLSGAELKARNINDVFDLQYETPSLQVTPQFGSSQLEFSIRGVGFEDYASNNAPTVGVYVDEVGFPVPFETNGLIYDVQRVEVLRGPQGTLYGRNTTGGAVNFVLNKPTHDFHGGLEVQTGRFGATKVDGYLSGSITDTVQVRLSGETEQGGAWQHGPDGQSLGNTDRTGLRALVDWEASDTLKFELNLHGGIDRSDGLGTHLYAPNTALYLLGEGPVLPADPNRDDTVWGTSPEFAKEIGLTPNTKPFNHVNTSGISLRADQDLGFATLTDLISYDYAARKELGDFDASQLALADVYFNTRADVFANEIRLTSVSGQRLSYVLGIYYANQFLADNYDGGFDQIYGIDTSVRYTQKVNTISGFGQASYKITDQIIATGGLRLEHETRTLDNFGSYFLFDGTIINPNNTANQSTSYTKPSGKVELQYIPFTDEMIYAEFSRGVKSGGFTTYNTGSPKLGTAPFLPETLWAYEIGNKIELPAAHLRINLAAFYYQYENEQIQGAVLNPTTGLVGSILNAPRSHLFGGELEMFWSPVRNLTLTQSFGEAIGQFDEFASLVSAVPHNGVFSGVYENRAGEALPAPKFTANGSISYAVPIGRYVLTAESDYSLRTTYNSLFGALYNVAGYTLVNARLTFAPDNGRWTLSAFGQNILNKQYDVDRNYFDAGDDIATAGLPATWGVRATVKF
jgi:outer membrane receptor protein involved in Fe transport